jgi:hypothetical protein
VCIYICVYIYTTQHTRTRESIMTNAEFTFIELEKIRNYNLCGYLINIIVFKFYNKSARFLSFYRTFLQQF